MAEEEKVEEEVGSLSTTFNPFQVKKNMRLAPLVRYCDIRALFLLKDPSLRTKRLYNVRLQQGPRHDTSFLRCFFFSRNDTAAAKRRIDTLEGPEGPDGLYLQLLK